MKSCRCPVDVNPNQGIGGRGLGRKLPPRLRIFALPHIPIAFLFSQDGMFSVKKFIMCHLGVIQFTQYVEQNYSITKTVKFFLNGFGLRSASEGSEVQVERQLERNWSVGETLFVASTGPRPRGRGIVRRCGRQELVQSASTGPRPRGRGIVIVWRVIVHRFTSFNGAAPARARNFHAHAMKLTPRERASTGPRPRGRGISHFVTRSGAGPQYFDCDCLHHFHYSYIRDVRLSHHY